MKKEEILAKYITLKIINESMDEIDRFIDYTGEFAYVILTIKLSDVDEYKIKVKFVFSTVAKGIMCHTSHGAGGLLGASYERVLSVNKGKISKVIYASVLNAIRAIMNISLIESIDGKDYIVKFNKPSDGVEVEDTRAKEIITKRLLTSLANCDIIDISVKGKEKFNA